MEKVYVITRRVEPIFGQFIDTIECIISTETKAIKTTRKLNKESGGDYNYGSTGYFYEPHNVL